MKALLAAIALTAASAAGANVWNCRNEDMEIACVGGQCTASLEHDFTPMSLAFNADGDVSVCVYSGCREGRGGVREQAGILSVVAGDLSFSGVAAGPHESGSRRAVAILLDRGDNVTLLKFGVFAQPMTCRTLDERETSGSSAR